MSCFRVSRPLLAALLAMPLFVRAVDAPRATPALAAAASLPSLDELEKRALPAETASDYLPALAQRSRDTVALIESNRLTTGADFFRAAKLVTLAENRFRAMRVRYELALCAAALDHAEAQGALAAGWDEFLVTLGRPMRTDFTGMAAKHPEGLTLEAAPHSVQAVLRAPAEARVAAKAAKNHPEMQAIVNADQADRRLDWGKLSKVEMEAVGARDDARNARTRAIVAAGELRTAADFANASLVMQHSTTFAGYQTAHELAVCAMLLGDRALGRWLIAATYDRMLDSIGHDQRFGTQYNGSSGVMTLLALDAAGICDAQRAALGCPTLEEARTRSRRPAEADASAKLAAEFSGPNRTLRDPQFGLSATYPEGWKIRDVSRWGDQQNTIFFEAAEEFSAAPNLYYKIYRTPRPLPADELAFVREEARKKEASRRSDGRGDYTNRAEGVKPIDLGGWKAFAWLADYTGHDEGKWTEYFVRVQNEAGDASFFLQAPSGEFEKLRPAVDQFMAGLKLPAARE